jgi:hypothetical protein
MRRGMDPEKMVEELRIALRLGTSKDTTPEEEWMVLLGYAAGCKLSHDELAELKKMLASVRSEPGRPSGEEEG